MFAAGTELDMKHKASFDRWIINFLSVLLAVRCFLRLTIC